MSNLFKVWRVIKHFLTPKLRTNRIRNKVRKLLESHPLINQFEDFSLILWRSSSGLAHCLILIGRQDAVLEASELVASRGPYESPTDFIQAMFSYSMIYSKRLSAAAFILDEGDFHLFWGHPCSEKRLSVQEWITNLLWHQARMAHNSTRCRSIQLPKSIPLCTKESGPRVVLLRSGKKPDKVVSGFSKHYINPRPEDV
jgi:hypothetical protein